MGVIGIKLLAELAEESSLNVKELGSPKEERA